MTRKRDVEIVNAHPGKRIRKRSMVQLVRRVLKAEQARSGELTIVFVNDKEMKRLNKKFLSRTGTTDVISFRLDDHRNIEGEVYVNVDQAERQAREFHIRNRTEVGRLVVHGVLHVIGYEDDTTSKRKVMHTLEDKYLEWNDRSS